MNNKKIFTFLFLIVAASLMVIACSPKPEAEQTSLSSADQPSSPPTEQPIQETTNTGNLGDCFNPYYPVYEGKVWRYNLVSGSETDTLNISYKDLTPSSFTSIQQLPDVSTEIQWTCSPDGLLSSEFANMSMAQIPGVTFETLEVNGVVFPKESLWQVGYSWTTDYLIKMKFTSGDTVFEGEGNLSVNNTIAAIEPVTVPAGTYADAFRVDAAGSFKLKVMGMEKPIVIDFSNWYVKDIGMVKSASTDPTLSYSMELTALD